MSQTDIFLDYYKQLEQTAITAYQLPSDGTAVSRLERMPQFSAVRMQIKFCRELRALLQHNPKIAGAYAVEPNAELIKFIKNLILEVENPKRCVDVASGPDKMVTAVFGDRLFPVMQRMFRNGYSHIPILDEKGKVAGIFSENTLLAYILKSGAGAISEQTTFADIREHLAIEKKKKYVFIRADTPISEAEKLFHKSFKKGERIVMMLLTKDGYANQKLMGIITPWDILGE